MNTKTRNTIVGVIVIVIVIGVIYYIYTNKETFRGPIKKYEYMDEIDMSEETKDKEGNMNKLVHEQLDNYPEDVIVGEKADLDIMWKNASEPGKYKYVSYLDGERDNESKLEDQDSYETQLAESVDYASSTNNDKFVASDNGNGNYAPYTQHKKEFTTKELMNSDGLLPKEEKDWFDTVPEPIKVKNRHLININRPIGVDTVGSSMKIACRDLRGNIPAPKFVVSPFLNSSVEPDVATVGFCNSDPYK